MLIDEPKKRKRSGTSCSCPYYRNEDGLTHLTNKIVGSIMDVEDLVKEGKEAMACPYYASRFQLLLIRFIFVFFFLCLAVWNK